MAISITIKGWITLYIRVRLILAILETTNNTIPIGGVIRPIQRFTTTINPKRNGSMPIITAAGLNIGTKIISAAVKSSKLPAINNKILEKNKKSMVLLWV